MTHSEPMRKAFILATGADTGGAAIRTVEAFRVAGGPQRSALLPTGEPSPTYNPNHWHVRSMVATINYIEYTTDVPYNRANLLQYYDEADVVQLNNTLRGHHLYDDAQGKPIVLMHHGLHEGHFAQSLPEVVTEATQMGATQIGSTVNLELYGQEGAKPGDPGSIQWCPIPYDLNRLREMRRGLYSPAFDAEDAKILRIGHAPTDRAVKSTESVISAVSSLKSKGFAVELVLIERQTHANTLRTKAERVDLYVDQLKLGYGCNAIEAWGMGIPVIAGFSEQPGWRDHAASRYQLTESPTGLPFAEADEANLEEVIEDFLVAPTLLDIWRKIGTTHVERWHSAEAGVRIFSEVYDRAIQQKTKTSVNRSARFHPATSST